MHVEQEPERRDEPEEPALADVSAESPAKSEAIDLGGGITVTREEAEKHYRIFQHLCQNDQVGFMMVYWEVHEGRGRFGTDHSSAKFLIDNGYAAADAGGKFSLKPDTHRLAAHFLRPGRVGEREVIWPEEFGQKPQ